MEAPLHPKTPHSPTPLRTRAALAFALGFSLLGCGDDLQAPVFEGGSSTSEAFFETDASSSTTHPSDSDTHEPKTTGEEEKVEQGIYCGDGTVQATEECDDGNQEDEDACNNQCEKNRLVFITNNVYGVNEIGWLEGADLICGKEAAAYNHPSPYTFRAWLSDGKNSPSTRFDHGKGHYQLSTGEIVAEDWKDLTDGTLLYPINRSIEGILLDEKAVFTGTQTNGTSFEKGHCEGWTDSSFSPVHYGYSSLIDSGWTDYTQGSAVCAGAMRLYCFEARI